MVYRNSFRGQHHNADNAPQIDLKTRPSTFIAILISLLLLARPASAIHHLQRPPVHLVNRQNSDLPLTVTNNCDETIYPAILTQSGTGPSQSGFRLDPGGSNHQNVSADWRGRVWGRTNCTFDEDGNVPASGQGGVACSSGDCGAFVECQGAVSRILFTMLEQSVMLKVIPRAIHRPRLQSLRSPHHPYNPSTISPW